MKKILALFALCMMALAIQAKDITIYVQAEKAPYIWAWESGSGGMNLTGGTWPGLQMTLKKTINETEFWYMTFTTEKTINVIFNDGGTDGKGTGAKQTGDINDITNADHFKWMLDEFLVCDLGNVNKAILMYTDVHKCTEVDDISHCTFKYHSHFEILHVENVAPKDRCRHIFTWVSSRTHQFFDNVCECHLTYTQFICKLFLIIVCKLFQLVYKLL